MIFLFTDFGSRASYVGQMHAVLARAAPGCPRIDLTHHAPAFDPRRAAYLLAAELWIAAPGDVVLAIVDPGVGTQRWPLALEADGVWLVGPDNGLLTQVAHRAAQARWWRIAWRPAHLSASFHGRDLFAPVAARLSQGDQGDLVPAAPVVDGAAWPADLDEVIFVDDYGNAMTGRRAPTLHAGVTLVANGQRFRPARTFADDADRAGFWYANSLGLVELSLREGSAARRFDLAVGTAVTLAPRPPTS